MEPQRYVRSLGSYEHGIWVLRLFGYFFRVKAPWNRPLFSERHAPKGLWVNRNGGWRFNIVKVGA